MTKETRQPFTEQGGYIARKSFTFKGVDYTPGDAFPWQDEDLDCSVRKLKQLYEGRFVEPAVAERPAKKKKPEAVEAPKQPEPTEDDEEGDGLDETDTSEESDDDTKVPQEDAAEKKKKRAAARRNKKRRK